MYSQWANYCFDVTNLNRKLILGHSVQNYKNCSQVLSIQIKAQCLHSFYPVKTCDWVKWGRMQFQWNLYLIECTRKYMMVDGLLLSVPHIFILTIQTWQILYRFKSIAILYWKNPVKLIYSMCWTIPNKQAANRSQISDCSIVDPVASRDLMKVDDPAKSILNFHINSW